MTVLITFLAMVAFAANSLLARIALSGNTIDPVSFTIIRLASGAVVLMALLVGRRGKGAIFSAPGNWASAVALFVYGLSFSLAYMRLSAATGALILFASVQVAMMFWGLVKKEWPSTREMAGQAIAFSAFVYLLLPGLAAPDPIGSLMMASSGVAWAIYSLRGRGSANPIDDTAGNFIRAAAICVPLIGVAALGAQPAKFGIILAVVSGGLTSGLGYVLWYSVLPKLSSTQAATVQLTVPIIAAVGGAVFLAEALTWRLALVSFFITGGTALAVLSRKLPVRADQRAAVLRAGQRE